MAVAACLFTLLAVIGLCLGFAALGGRILRLLQVTLATSAENLLVSTALGILAFELLLFLAQYTQHICAASWILVAFLALALLSQLQQLSHQVVAAFRQMLPATLSERLLLAATFLVTAVEFVSSMAPLNGSDALHYHFTVQKQILAQGFAPLFSISHSFLCGQHHLLILFGLALGSEHLALGLIFLGGLLAVASMVCLMPPSIPRALVASLTLLFLVTPVVFWQISTSGSPDIFMAFFVCATLIVLRHSDPSKGWRRAALAGLLTGGIAGAKYTGCIIAAAFLLAALLEFRSLLPVAAFFFSSVISGIAPYLRNFLWTGNPVFPFLSSVFTSHGATAFAIANLAGDTGAAQPHRFSQLIPFIFFAAMNKNSPGFWDFFGPTILAIAPLLFLSSQKLKLWKIPSLVWFASALGLFFASGLPRFLLPVYPIAVCAVALALTVTSEEQLPLPRMLGTAIVALMILAGSAGLAIYAKKPAFVALGFLDKTTYLQQSSQEFTAAEEINRVLGQQTQQKRALLFIRHLYYLNVPYLNGDPASSFAVDPNQLQTPQQWSAFFKNNNIGFVVRAPNYPAEIDTPLSAMEQSGDLVPIAQTQVASLQGTSINRTPQLSEVVILRVAH